MKEAEARVPAGGDAKGKGKAKASEQPAAASAAEPRGLVALEAKMMALGDTAARERFSHVQRTREAFDSMTEDMKRDLREESARLLLEQLGEVAGGPSAPPLVGLFESQVAECMRLSSRQSHQLTPAPAGAHPPFLTLPYPFSSPEWHCCVAGAVPLAARALARGLSTRCSRRGS